MQSFRIQSSTILQKQCVVVCVCVCKFKAFDDPGITCGFNPEEEGKLDEVCCKIAEY